MAYCRWSSDSDVYLYRSTEKQWVCADCRGNRSAMLTSREEVLAHLLDHREKGDRVPEYAFERIRSEIASGEDEPFWKKHLPG